MLTQICNEINNFFSVDDDKFIGNFSIENGEIVSPVPLNLQANQYYRIVGSVFNDGVHKVGDELTDEPEFRGAVWRMRVPQDVLQLAQDIEEWQAKYGTPDSANMSPYNSESFGGYSYSKAQGYAAAGGGMMNTWNVVFASRLNQYRKIRV